MSTQLLRHFEPKKKILGFLWFIEMAKVDKDVWACKVYTTDNSGDEWRHYVSIDITLKPDSDDLLPNAVLLEISRVIFEVSQDIQWCQSSEMHRRRVEKER